MKKILPITLLLALMAALAVPATPGVALAAQNRGQVGDVDAFDDDSDSDSDEDSDSDSDEDSDSDSDSDDDSDRRSRRGRSRNDAESRSRTGSVLGDVIRDRQGRTIPRPGPRGTERRATPDSAIRLLQRLGLIR